VDKAPAQVWATLLDEGTYLASVSTMYRLLAQRHQVRERRAQARRPACVKPELVATQPNEVWSWDITKLAGPYKWTVVPALHHPGRLLALRGGLVGRPTRVGGARRATHCRRDLPQRG